MDTIKVVRDACGALRLEHPYVFPNATAVTVGTFDGVHLGHLALLTQLKREAALRHLSSMVVTFDRSPLATVRPGHPYTRLNDGAEQLTRLEAVGVDITVVLPFDGPLSLLDADQFLEQVVVKMLHAHYMLLGYDHSFGHASHYGNQLNIDQLATRHGLTIQRADMACDTEGNPFSSTRIKQLLGRGEVVAANQLLGYRYPLSGIVVSGQHIGRTLGYPTANIVLAEPHKLVPPNGVYAVYVRVGERVFPGMLYIGNRPTISSEQERSIEVHLFDLDEELYNKSICIELEKFVRRDQRFSGREELIRAIQEDERVIRELLGCSKV